MMGVQQAPQGNLFYYGINVDKRIRANHPLRRVKQMIDFDFSYQEVKGQYGANGNVSVPPAIILKLMLLLVLYNVRSERELMATVPERLDWLWFLDYDLDTEIPNHSVLSKTFVTSFIRTISNLRPGLRKKTKARIPPGHTSNRTSGISPAPIPMQR